MTKRSLLLHFLLTLAAATFASGQAPAIPPVTVDDLAAEIPRAEIQKLKKTKGRAEIEAQTKPLTDALRQKWNNKKMVIQFKFSSVAQSNLPEGGLSQQWFVWGSHLVGGKGAEKVEVSFNGELPPGAVLDKGKALKKGSEVVVSGTVQNIAMGMRVGHEAPTMRITMLVDDIVKAK